MYVSKTGTCPRRRARWIVALSGAIGWIATSVAVAAPNDLDFHITQDAQRLEMVVDTSRILTLEEEIPRVLVNNQALVKVVPLSPNKVQVSAVKPGVTQINLWGKSGDVHSVDVVVYADARQLELVLQSEFPDAAIRVRPLASSVILTGFVDRPEIVDRVVRIASDYYPKVINNISIGGVQQICLNVRVMEVQRSKLRSLGVDWAFITGNDFVVSTAAGIISATSDIASGSAGLNVVSNASETFQFGIVDGSNIFNGFIEALRTNNYLKILAEPKLVTVSGRPATFNEGGEFPVIIPQGLGQNTVEYKTFGTRVDFVPIVLGNGNIRLDVRPEVSELDVTQGINLNGVVVPGVRSRFVDTAVEMRAGQTLALAGLIQSREISTTRGLPWLADLPWAGTLFRKVNTDHNEVELLMTVRPELVAALDPHQVPRLGPGENSTLPGDIDLYARGYSEVPRCCPPRRCEGPRRSAAPSAGYPINGLSPQFQSPQSQSPQSQPAGPSLGAPQGDGQAMQPGMMYGQPNGGGSHSSAMPSGQSLPGYGSSMQEPMVPGSGFPDTPPPGAQPVGELLGPTGYDEIGY